MNSGISKIISVITAVFIAMASVMSVCFVNVFALDQNFVKEGTVPIVLYLKDVYVIEYIPELDMEVSREFVGSEFEYGHGSGFFIGKGKNNPEYIVTNNHVVEDYVKADENGGYEEVIDVYEGSFLGIEYTVYSLIQARSCELRVYYSENDYERLNVKCHGNTEIIDLAVLSLDKPTDKRHALKIAPVSDNNVSEAVYTVGYPGNADNDLSAASRLGMDDATVRKGIISRIVRDKNNVERVATDATIHHGNSGGPFVNEKGYVLGVNTNVISNSPYDEQIEADYYAISSNELMAFLDNNNIPYQKAGGSSKIIVISAIGVVILAVAAVILKKKGKLTFPSFKAKPSAPSVPQAQEISAKKAFIRSMSAQHNGKTFPVGKAPVVIGRDPSNCVIVFSEGTQGVSGIHCSVSYDSETDIFTLTDLGSTYGTYLIGGQQVLAKTSLTLRSGDSFYVGDKANVCRVEVVK